jgi:hypothetical protein
MMILEHETVEKVIVLADDKGLKSPMTRDAEGKWVESMDAAPNILDNYVQIRDKDRQNILLQDALAAYNKIHKHPHGLLLIAKLLVSAFTKKKLKV